MQDMCWLQEASKAIFWLSSCDPSWLVMHWHSLKWKSRRTTGGLKDL